MILASCPRNSSDIIQRGIFYAWTLKCACVSVTMTIILVQMIVLAEPAAKVIARARARDTSNCRFTRLHEDRWIGTSGNARRNFTTGNGRKHRSSARTTRTAESWIRAVIANEKETERDGFCWQLLIARIRIACAFSRSARGGTRIETANRSMARALSSFGNAKSRKLICKPFPADGTNTQEISYLGPEKPETPSSENIFFQIIRIARLFGAVVVCDGFANVNSTSCAITWLSEGSS